MVKREPVRKTAKGREYWYNREGRGAIRLLSAPGSSGFWREFEAANRLEHSPPLHTVSDIAVRFLQSGKWDSYSPKTKKVWRPKVDRIRQDLGSKRLKVFEDARSIEAISQWRSQWDEFPRTADYHVQVLSRLLSFARKHGAISLHHCKDVDKLYRNNRAHIIWTDSEIDAFRRNAPPHLVLAVDLALLTGLRLGDLITLKWAQIHDDVIEVATSKSRGDIIVQIPIYEALAKVLNDVPKFDHGFVLYTIKGTPWRTGFDASFRDAKKRIGIDKHFHDLRGTAATRLYMAKFEPKDIARLMGWSEKSVLKILDRYVGNTAKNEELKLRLQAAWGR